MIDLDERITANEGRSPAELIVEDGESAFRKVETSTLHDVLQSGEAKVISLGGGAWIQEANRELINQYGCLSLWLDTPFEVCWATSLEVARCWRWGHAGRREPRACWGQHRWRALRHSGHPMRGWALSRDRHRQAPCLAPPCVRPW